MDPDLFLTIGVVLAILCIPSMLSAWTDGRIPRFAAIIALTAGALIAVAATNKGGGYKISEVPTIMLNVAARYVK